MPDSDLPDLPSRTDSHTGKKLISTELKLNRDTEWATGCGDGHTALNIVKLPQPVYYLNEWILWYMKYISKKL